MPVASLLWHPRGPATPGYAADRTVWDGPPEPIRPVLRHWASRVHSFPKRRRGLPRGLEAKVVARHCREASVQRVLKGDRLEVYKQWGACQSPLRRRKGVSRGATRQGCGNSRGDRGHRVESPVECQSESSCQQVPMSRVGPPAPGLLIMPASPRCWSRCPVQHAKA